MCLLAKKLDRVPSSVERKTVVDIVDKMYVQMRQEQPGPESLGTTTQLPQSLRLCDGNLVSHITVITELRLLDCIQNPTSAAAQDRSKANGKAYDRCCDERAAHSEGGAGWVQGRVSLP